MRYSGKEKPSSELRVKNNRKLRRKLTIDKNEPFSRDDVEKFVGWFGKKPVFIEKMTENDKGPMRSRIVAVFVRDAESEIDMEYWKKDAEYYIIDK